MSETQVNKLAAFIDHTLLKPDATQEQIDTLCKEAIKYRFATVCINPCWVSYAKECLADYPHIGITTVIGFPLGATTSKVKAFEAHQAVEDGATEIDMVLNIGYLKNGFYDAVRDDIAAVVKSSGDKIVKVILETCLLSEKEIEIACKLSVEAGAHYVKTSTGFSTGGATKEHIQLMRQTVGPNIGVKASGGVRDQQATLELIEAGASRIGASASIAIVEGKAGNQAGY